MHAGSCCNGLPSPEHQYRNYSLEYLSLVAQDCLRLLQKQKGFQAIRCPVCELDCMHPHQPSIRIININTLCTNLKCVCQLQIPNECIMYTIFIQDRMGRAVVDVLRSDLLCVWFTYLSVLSLCGFSYWSLFSPVLLFAGYVIFVFV